MGGPNAGDPFIHQFIIVNHPYHQRQIPNNPGIYAIIPIFPVR